MSFKFEKLKVWQKAMNFGEDIHNLVLTFPDFEKFNLASQSKRAVDYIALNISEGSIEQSTLEFKIFIGYSIRSLAEVMTCFYKMKRRNYINEEIFKKNYDEGFHLMNMLITFRNSIK